ncbi:MAG: cell division protein FtsQ [Bernardetiaceae bacterium]|jgi:cell division protein FtsQ|nr:cell division protein FtsQ [Bernardetiaceae bacterium]
MKRFRLKKRAQIGLVVIGLFVVLGFASRQYARVDTGRLIVRIDSVDENKFVTEADVVGLLAELKNADSSASPLGLTNLKAIERKIKRYGFVADCQVSRDLAGNLVVEVQQRKPLGRIAARKRGCYIGFNGGKMPLSDKFTARVPIITGEGADSLYRPDTVAKADVLTKRRGKPVLELLKFIDADPFWKAQIAQVDLDRYGNVSLYPQVGNQVVELGTLDNLELKMNKLKLFYEQIVPVKGWDAYKKVKLGFEGQIVCE